MYVVDSLALSIDVLDDRVISASCATVDGGPLKMHASRSSASRIRSPSREEVRSLRSTYDISH